MKLKYNFEIVQIGDESVGVPVGEGAEAYGSILQCNETAAMILKLLKNDTTEAQVIAGIQDEYDAPAGVIEKKVHNFIAMLQEKDLLA